MAMKKEPPIMTLTEVAAVLRVRRAVAWRLVTSGKLRAFRAGKNWRVQQVDLEKFIDKGGGLLGKRRRK
jgi:excisionase family DNA binding protein